MKVSDI